MIHFHQLRSSHVMIGGISGVAIEYLNDIRESAALSRY
jgi:hypothetical protein